MGTPNANRSSVSPAWCWATFSLGGVLVLSWALLGYALVDSGVSLTYCRAEQDHLRHDIQVFLAAAKGRLASSAFVAARAELDPELPRSLEERNTLRLRTVVLQFGDDALFRGAAPEEP